MARTKRKVNPLAAAPAKPKEKKIYRTGGYACLSVEDGGRAGADTIKTQEEMILRYIEAQPDMEFAGMYCDNGKSGTDFHRPEFERLLGDVKSGKIIYPVSGEIISMPGTIWKGCFLFWACALWQSLRGLIP